MGKLSAPSTITSYSPRISRMLEASSRIRCSTTSTSGLSASIVEPGRLGLRHPDPLGVVDHLALQVGGVDHVVVDQAERADPGRREVERGRSAEPAGADQQHLRVRAASAGPRRRPREAACGGSSARAARRHPLGRDHRQALLLPGEDAARHRGDVLVAERLHLRGGERRAVAAAAVEDRAGRAGRGPPRRSPPPAGPAAPACRPRGGPPGTRAARGCRSGRRRRRRSPPPPRRARSPRSAPWSGGRH